MPVLSLFWMNAITYENPGIRLELLLRDLSRLAGIELHCTPYLNNEVIVASFRDQGFDIVKKQLAVVLNGTWEERKDGWWLVQTSDQKKAEERAMHERRTQILQLQLEGMRNVAPKSEWTTKDAEKYWIDLQASRKRTGEGIWNGAQRKAFRLKSPESRFVAGIAAKLQPNMFAADPTKPDFHWYSFRGLPNQVSLPLDISDSLRQFNNEMLLLRTISADGNASGSSASNVEITYDTSEVPYLVATFYDQDWRYVVSGLPTAFLPYNMTALAENFALSAKTQETIAVAKQLPVYNPTEEAMEKIRKSPSYQEAAATLKTARTHDPLGILQGRCWIDFARSVGKPLLVNLEDDPGVLRPKNFVPAIEQKEFCVGMKRADAEGWILGLPQNPQRNRAWRVDRSQIERLAALTYGKDQGFNSKLQQMDIWCYAMLFTNNIPNAEFLDDTDFGIKWSLGALGTLTPDQLASCLRGATIAVTSMPERAQYYMAQMVGDGYVNALSPVPGSDNDSRCPRYCLPNGIVGIRIGAKVETTIYFSFTENVVGLVAEGAGDGEDLETFAAMMKDAAQKSSPLLSRKFIVSTYNRFSSVLHLGSKKMTEDLDLSRSDSSEFTWQTLPDSIKKQVLDAMKGNGGR